MIGNTPNQVYPESTYEYGLYVIEPTGFYRLFKGNIQDILGYFKQWLKECIKKPKTEDTSNQSLAERMIDDINNGIFEDLSLQVHLMENYPLE